jgi:hypothetical protein
MTKYVQTGGKCSSKTAEEFLEKLSPRFEQRGPVAEQCAW